MVGSLLFKNGLVEPILNWCSGATLGLALNLGDLGFVCRKFACNVGLLGGSGCLGDGEVLDLALGIGSLDGGGLVGLELAEVKVLDQIGCLGISGLNRVGSMNWRDGYVP